MALLRERFQSGPCALVLAPCGVWQNTQSSLSLLARTVPGPLAERLCLVLATSLVVAANARFAERPRHKISEITERHSPDKDRVMQAPSVEYMHPSRADLSPAR